MEKTSDEDIKKWIAEYEEYLLNTEPNIKVHDYICSLCSNDAYILMMDIGNYKSYQVPNKTYKNSEDYRKDLKNRLVSNSGFKYQKAPQTFTQGDSYWLCIRHYLQHKRFITTD